MGSTGRVTKCAGVSVAVVTAEKYGLGLRQIRILTRENTACREARRNMRWPIPPIYSLCTTTSFLPRGHKGHAFPPHHHYDQLKQKAQVEEYQNERSFKVTNNTKIVHANYKLQEV